MSYRFEDTTPRQLGKFTAQPHQGNSVNLVEDILINDLDIQRKNQTPLELAHNLLQREKLWSQL